LVIDGLVMAGSMAESEIDTKEFIHELQAFVELVGCTTILLTGAGGADEQYALRTMVDGLLELRLDSMGMEARRTLEITKFRGSNMLPGRHLFTITAAGLTIYPRMESLAGKAPSLPDPTSARPATFGIDALDTMLAGGLRTGSITMVLGAPGSGKTLLGLSLLAAGAKEGKPGLYFGFFERSADLTRRADAIGLGLSEFVNKGLVDIMWQSPLEGIADALAQKLIVAIRDRGVRRLFIDGVGGFKDTLVYAERSRRFFTALCNELRSLGVVTVLSDETRSLPESEIPEHGLTAMLDNVVSLRHVELGAQLHKLISVTKMRDGAGDPSVREYSIERRGFVVASASNSAETALGGLGRERGLP
jgi:circadian clock protein KaiC